MSPPDSQPAVEAVTVPPSQAFTAPIREGPGSRIGPYKVLQLIGEGGFGSVFMAEQEHPVQRKVALKIIKLGMDTRQVVARFEQERQALAILDHPNIAKVFDAGATDTGRPYFAMELCTGEPIDVYCDRNALTIRQRLELFTLVCGAVQHAHTKGLIHRDLKPGNILVSTVDDKPHPRIIDFGIAKATASRMTEKTFFTEHKALIGTPEYMSPEQAEGSLDIDTRTDVYSLGVLLYELLTGTTPFDRQQLRSAAYGEIQRIIREVEPIKPSTRISQDTDSLAGVAARRQAEARRLGALVRGELDWIVMRALEKDRQRRYETAAGLAADIQRHLRDEPVTARPPSAGYLARKFMRRHRAGMLAGAGVLLALLLGFAGTSVGLIRAHKQREVAQGFADAAVAARDEAEVVTAFLSDMLESADPDARGRDARVIDVLDAAADSIGAGLAGKPLAEARLRQTLGNTYGALGRWDKAEPHLLQSLELRRKHLGEDHNLTSTSLGNVASMRYHQGRFQETEEILTRAIAARRRPGVADDATTLGMMNNLAQTYSRQGRRAAAAELQAQVLEGQRRVNGPDHPHTLGAVVNLALLSEALGNTDQARSLLEESIERWRKAHGPEHPGTLLALSNLGDMHYARGSYADAEVLQQRVLEARTRILTEDHPDTLATMSNLARTLKARGNFAQAEPLFIKAWENSRRVRGDGHPDTLTMGANLVELYEAQGWPESGRDQVARVVAGLAAYPAYPDATPESLNNCAWLLLTVQPESLRNVGAALEAAGRACSLERAAGGAELWQYLDTLALAQHGSGDHAAAAANQREAIQRVPPAGQRYLGEMQQRLAEYEAAAKGG